MPKDLPIARSDQLPVVNAMAIATQMATLATRRKSTTRLRLAGVASRLLIAFDYDLTWQPVHVACFRSSLPVSSHALAWASWPELGPTAASFSKYSRALASLPALTNPSANPNRSSPRAWPESVSKYELCSP